MKGCDIDGPLALSAVNYGDAIQHSTMAEPVNHGAEPVSEIIVDADTGHDTYPYGGKAQDECHRLAREQDHDEHDDERAGKIEADREYCLDQPHQGGQGDEVSGMPVRDIHQRPE